MKLTRKGFITRSPRFYNTATKQVVRGRSPSALERKEDRAFNRMVTYIRAWRVGR
jgi:hypothetical protein